MKKQQILFFPQSGGNAAGGASVGNRNVRNIPNGSSKQQTNVIFTPFGEFIVPALPNSVQNTNNVPSAAGKPKKR